MSIAPKRREKIHCSTRTLISNCTGATGAEKKAQPTSGVKKENSLSGQIGSSKNNINIKGMGFTQPQ